MDEKITREEYTLDWSQSKAAYFLSAFWLRGVQTSQCLHYVLVCTWNVGLRCYEDFCSSRTTFL